MLDFELQTHQDRVFDAAWHTSERSQVLAHNDNTAGA